MMTDYWETADTITIDNDYELKASPHDNCIYYNSSNHKIIFDTYNGIPQNLILNFLAWLILMVLFTILRKRAGNYGRLALIQKTDYNLQWTQLFYGGLDSESIDSSHETSSIDSSNQYDKGPFSWVLAIFRIGKEEIVEKCGPDAAQYLSFQRHIICFMFIMMCTSLIIVLPTNFQGHLEGDENNFGHTTVSNLDPDSPLLWIHVVLSVLYLPLAIYIMRRFSVRAKIKESYVASSRTVMIFNIPTRVPDIADLLDRHFREAFPELAVRDIQPAFDVNLVTRLKRERDRAAHAKEYCEKHFRNRGSLTITPHRCGVIWQCCHCRCCPQVDALEFYTREERRLNEAYERAVSAAIKKQLGVAFVTMETVDDARALLIDFQRSWKCGGLGGRDSTSSALAQLLKPQQWIVTFAPARNDVFWENLAVNSQFWYFKAITINLILFLVLFFLTTPAYVVNLVNSVPLSNAIQTINPVLSQFVPTLILWTVAALLPVLVSYSDQWLSHWTRSEQNYSIMLKTFIFLMFMVLILPSIGLTSAKAFVDWTWHLKNETYRWECLFLPDKGAFFVNYVTTSTFIGTSLELIRFPELFMYALRLSLVRSKAEIPFMRKMIVWEFPFGVQYAWMLLIFAMTTMYSLSCPLITPFGLLYMLLKHCVDKHNLYYAYSPSKISSEIHAMAINCVVFSVILVQASFLGLSVLRKGLNAISCFALAGFCMTILFFLFLVFFSCCKGFSPISFQRKSESVPTSPGRVSSSQWFVPDVLIRDNEMIDEDREREREGDRERDDGSHGSHVSYGTQGVDPSVSISIIPQSDQQHANPQLYQEYQHLAHA